MALVTSSIHFVDSDVNTHFTSAISGIVGASTYANIQIAEGSQSVGSNKLVIKSVRLLSMQQIPYRVEFWERSVPLATGSINAHGLLGSVDLIDINATQPSSYYATSYTTGTLFAFVAEQLDIPYHDKTGQGQLHVNLVLRNDNIAKSANSAGAVHLRVGTITAS